LIFIFIVSFDAMQQRSVRNIYDFYGSPNGLVIASREGLLLLFVTLW